MGEDEAMVSGGPAELRERLHSLRRVSQVHESMVPDVVTGDFDSVAPDVLDFYAKRGCTIAHDTSQSTTDFEKALGLVEEAQAATLRSNGSTPASSSLSHQETRRSKWTVIAFGAFGDRFDHEMASVNVLHRYRRFDRLVLMGERMTACLLPPGRHLLRPNPQIEGPTCGLLPVGGPCEAVWTSGLRWNLRGARLAFGGLVSTSNQLLQDADNGAVHEVRITNTHPLVWTTTLRPDGWPRGW